MDEHGQAIRVPEWKPVEEGDIKQYKTAEKLMEMRKTIGKEMQIFVQD